MSLIPDKQIKSNGHVVRPVSLKKRYVKPVEINPKMPSKVKTAVADALARQARAALEKDNVIRVGDDWDGLGRRAHLHLPDEITDEEILDQAVVRPMPRRSQAKSEDWVGHFQPPRPRHLPTPRISFLAVLRRLWIWINAFLFFRVGTWMDQMRGIDSEERRAVRLRMTFERVGGTFVKIGQQMASRLDMLPPRYCQELGSMLDQFPAFPTEQAIAIIEENIGQPLGEVFSEFDPKPIGSASIACVYQARLRSNGRKVAVKVRRPGIHALFETDFRVLDLISFILEGLTVVQHGYTQFVRDEFRRALNSELNFLREGRLCELFRRRARKQKERGFTSPEIFFEHSTDEVLVQEFVSGMWLWEVLLAVEQKDPVAIQRMRELNIDPIVLSKRLLYTHNWALYGHLAFHADPHPANIVVRANNELVFIDFGACGYLNKPRRELYMRAYAAFEKDDPAIMAQTSLAISEPLPAVDMNALKRDLEQAFYEHMLVIKSKKAPWYERTSASMFTTTLQLTSKYNIPAPQDFLMFTRASLLYDTLAARLNDKIDFYKENRVYAKRVAKKTRKRNRKALQKRLTSGRLFNAEEIAMAEKVTETAGDVLFQVRRLLAVPYDFAVFPFVIEKWAYLAMMGFRFVSRVALVTLVLMTLHSFWRWTQAQPLDTVASFRVVTQSAEFFGIIILIAIMHLRLVWFRLSEKSRDN